MLTAAAVTGVLSVPGAFAFADSGADAAVADSPGLVAGNNVQVPIHVPVNVCGNSVNVLAVLNPAFGGQCANGSTPTKQEVTAPKPKAQPPAEKAPDPVPQHKTVHQAQMLPAPALAETGGNPATVAAAGLGAVLLTGGVVLYRRGRAVARR
jgi:hypothetical protein